MRTSIDVREELLERYHREWGIAAPPGCVPVVRLEGDALAVEHLTAREAFRAAATEHVRAGGDPGELGQIVDAMHPPPGHFVIVVLDHGASVAHAPRPEAAH